jgi:hypothetical protein
MYVVWLIQPNGRRYCAHAFHTMLEAETYGIAQIDGKAWSHYSINFDSTLEVTQ